MCIENEITFFSVHMLLVDTECEDCDGPLFAVNVLCRENCCGEYDECTVIVLEVRGGVLGDGGGESGKCSCMCLCEMRKVWTRAC